jgi:phosphatidylglycerophosphatase A
MDELKTKLTTPIHWLAFGLGSGLAPKAPGTFGTLAALPIWWWLLKDLSLMPYIAMLIITFIVGIYLCDKTSKDMGVHDHGGIVWDEWVGIWITLLLLPQTHTVAWLIVGFVLFRFFDIVKPWPIKWLDQKVSGGFGIMIDDVVAGIFSLIVLQLMIVFI